MTSFAWENPLTPLRGRGDRERFTHALRASQEFHIRARSTVVVSSDPGASHRLRLLVAEDDAGLSRLYELLLAHHGYEVQVAPDGVEALAAVERSGLPDAALLDIEMPRLDGLELCRRLRQLGPALPIVIVTAREDAEEPAARAGATRVLGKSCDWEVVLEALADVLGGTPPATSPYPTASGR
jgi:CheY-like chemotaxis protein